MEKRFTSDILEEILSKTLTADQVKEIVAKRIKFAMKKCGMKSKDLAIAMNKSEAEVSKWLSGSHNFTIQTLAEIGQALKTTLI